MDFGNDLGASTPDPEGSGMGTGPMERRQCYQIRFRGHLGSHWTDWFRGCSLTHEEDGTTTMVAPVLDQADLFGLLNKVRDLSLTLISVSEVKPNDDSDPEKEFKK